MPIKLTRLCFYFSEIALWNQNYTFQRIFEFSEDSSPHESDIFHWSHSVLFMVSCVTRGSYRGFSRNCITINTLVLTKTDSDSVCRSQRSLTNIDGSMPHIGWHSIEIISNRNHYNWHWRHATNNDVIRSYVLISESA